MVETSCSSPYSCSKCVTPVICIHFCLVCLLQASPSWELCGEDEKVPATSLSDSSRQSHHRRVTVRAGRADNDRGERPEGQRWGLKLLNLIASIKYTATTSTACHNFINKAIQVEEPSLRFMYKMSKSQSSLFDVIYFKHQIAMQNFQHIYIMNCVSEMGFSGWILMDLICLALSSKSKSTFLSIADPESESLNCSKCNL